MFQYIRQQLLDMHSNIYFSLAEDFASESHKTLETNNLCNKICLQN